MSAREEAGWIDMKDVRKAEEHLRTECGSARHLLLAFGALLSQYEAGTSAASECAPKMHSLRLETMSLLRQMAERPFSSSGSTRLVLQQRSGRSGEYCRNSWRLWCTHPYSPRQETGFLKRQGAARLRRKRTTQRGPTEATRQSLESPSPRMFCAMPSSARLTSISRVQLHWRPQLPDSGTL